MMRSIRSMNWSLCAVALVAACGDDPPDPSGNLNRPSGLAYIEHDDGTADLLIADSEAQGVRVVQLRSDGVWFVPSPALFFPLAIPATGFPTDIAAFGGRAYVLAPSRCTNEPTPKCGVVHVLHVEAAAFGISSSNADTYYPLAEISLSGYVADATAVDIAVLPARGGQHQVVVAFDEGTQGRLIVLSVDPATGAATFVDSAIVEAGPTEIAVRSEAPAGVLVASVAGRKFSFVPLGVGADVLDQPVSLDAGGPTRAIIDAGKAGALALRLDRPAAVAFDVLGGQLVRSAATMVTPFTDLAAVGTATEAGVLALRSSPPVAGAHAQRSSLFAPGSTTELFSPSDLDATTGLGDAVLIAHTDGLQSLLIGKPFRVAVTQTSTIVHADRTRRDDVTVVQCPGVSPPLSCQESIDRVRAELDIVQGGSAAVPACRDGMINVHRTFARNLYARYRGALVSTRGGTLIRDRVAAAGAQTFVLSHPNFTTPPDLSYLERAIATGDGAMIQIEAACSGSTRRFVSTGTVTAVGATQLLIDLPATDPLTMAVGCPAELEVRRYELFPGGREVVVTNGLGSGATVLERRAVTTAGSKDSVQLLQPLRATIESAAGFGCTVEPASVGCQITEDCGTGDCVQESGQCPLLCSNPCNDANQGCPFVEMERVCSGIKFEMTGATQSLIQIDDAQTQPVLPDDVVYAPVRQSWYVSLPGVRAVSETSAVTRTLRVFR